MSRKTTEIKKVEKEERREEHLLREILVLLKIIGERIMGIQELNAAIAANTAQTGSVTTTDAAAVAALGAGSVNLDAATQQITDNTAALKTANDALAAAIPPPSVATPNS